MSDEKKYTERDMIVAKRGAYIEGALADHNATGWVRDMGRVEREAHAKYPMPKVTRPRVVDDPRNDSFEWSVRDGVMCFRWKHAAIGAWRRAVSTGEQNLLLDVEPERVKLWADLLANPTEEVEDGAA